MFCQTPRTHGAFSAVGPVGTRWDLLGPVGTCRDLSGPVCMIEDFGSVIEDFGEFRRDETPGFAKADGIQLMTK